MLPVRRVVAQVLHAGTQPMRLARRQATRALAWAICGLGASTATARELEAQAGRGAADSMPISLRLRDVPLQEALERLVAASGISLQYDTRVLRARAADPPRISCDVERRPAEALLGCIVQEAGLDYYRLSTGTYVVIARAEDAPAYATLSGIVVDAASGSPLPAARIALAERPDVRVANEAGSFAFTGVDASLEHGREVLAEAGSFAFTDAQAREGERLWKSDPMPTLGQLAEREELSPWRNGPSSPSSPSRPDG
jgi:hypothetical protein